MDHLQELVNRFITYNLWANERMATWLLTVDKKLLYREIPSSFGTIDRTLQHILAAQHYWYAAIVLGEIKEFDEPVKENAVEDVIANIVISSQKLADNISKFTGEELLQTIRVTDSSQSRYEYILHVVNHSSYHRGQVVILCRAVGFTGEIPVTDYDAYLWWIENM